MRHCTINLIAAGACLACGVLYTVTNRPLAAVALLVVLGLANLAFILVRQFVQFLNREFVEAENIEINEQCHSRLQRRSSP